MTEVALIRDRSGLVVLAALAAIAVVVQPFAYFNPVLPATLVFSLYLAWLGCVFVALKARGRRWSRSAMAALPFSILLAYGVGAVFLGGSELATSWGPSAGALGLLAYAAIWDHVAISVARRSVGGGMLVYTATMLLGTMSPFAILWVQHRLHENTDPQR